MRVGRKVNLDFIARSKIGIPRLSTTALDQIIAECVPEWDRCVPESEWRARFETELRSLLSADTRLVAFRQTPACKEMERQVRRRTSSIVEDITQKRRAVVALVHDHHLRRLQEQCSGGPTADRPEKVRVDLEQVRRWLAEYAAWMDRHRSHLLVEQRDIDCEMSNTDRSLAKLRQDHHMLVERYARLVGSPGGTLLDPSARITIIEAVRASVEVVPSTDEVLRLQETRRDYVTARQKAEAAKGDSRPGPSHGFGSTGHTVRDRRTAVLLERKCEREWTEARRAASADALRYFVNEDRLEKLERLEALHRRIDEMEAGIRSLADDVADWTSYKETVVNDIPPFELPFEEGTRSDELVRFAECIVKRN